MNNRFSRNDLTLCLVERGYKKLKVHGGVIVAFKDDGTEGKTIESIFKGMGFTTRLFNEVTAKNKTRFGCRVSGVKFRLTDDQVITL